MRLSLKFAAVCKDGSHYDGALNEDTRVAIGGYGPTKATFIDGGELFGKSR